MIAFCFQTSQCTIFTLTVMAFIYVVIGIMILFQIEHTLQAVDEDFEIVPDFVELFVRATLTNI